MLLRLKQKNAESWERFVTLYRPLILHWIRRWFEKNGAAPHSQDDIAQEVFCTVDKYIVDFDRQRKASFRTWLHRVTDSRTADWCRKCSELEPTLPETKLDALHKIPDPAFDENQETPDDAETERKILLQSIMQLIQRDFSEKTWQAFVMSAVDGMTAAAIAAELAMSEVGVRQAKSRVLKRIRDEFGEITE